MSFGDLEMYSDIKALGRIIGTVLSNISNNLSPDVLRDATCLRFILGVEYSDRPHPPDYVFGTIPIASQA